MLLFASMDVTQCSFNVYDTDKTLYPKTLRILALSIMLFQRPKTYKNTVSLNLEIYTAI